MVDMEDMGATVILLMDMVDTAVIRDMVDMMLIHGRFIKDLGSQCDQEDHFFQSDMFLQSFILTLIKTDL